MRFAWPLTGRSQEMRTIEAAIAAPSVAGIVVCGAAGVGKSRIVREALNAAASNGAEVRWAVGSTSAKSLPLGALAAWTQTGPTDTVDLVRAAIESLTAAPPGTPAIVGVDDAHLLDDLSAFVLHQIVQREAAKVVVTVRDGEPACGPGPSPCGSKGIVVDVLGACGRARAPVRRCKHPGAAQAAGAVAAERP